MALLMTTSNSIDLITFSYVWTCIVQLSVIILQNKFFDFTNHKVLFFKIVVHILFAAKVFPPGRKNFQYVMYLGRATFFRIEF